MHTNTTPQFCIVKKTYESITHTFSTDIIAYANARDQARDTLWLLMKNLTHDRADDYTDALLAWLDCETWRPTPVVTWQNGLLTATFTEKIETYEIHTCQQPVRRMGIL